MRRLTFVSVLACALAVAPAQTVRVLPTPEQAVKDGANLTRFDAKQAERELEAKPYDPVPRAKLLGYYFYQWMNVGQEEAKAARRRHILWVIENQPESSTAGLYEATLEPRGHQLADEEGFFKARDLFEAYMQGPRGANPRLLGNIGKFFQLHDRALAESALLKAAEIDPQNGEWRWRLGYLYGLGILGIDGLAFNGQPASIDPLEADGPFAAKAREALKSSTSALELAVAGNVIARWGTMLAPSEIARVAHLNDATKLYRRAQELEPGNPSWKQMLQEAEALKLRMQPADPGSERSSRKKN